MKTLINIVYSLAAAASLAACGGGGGADAPTTTSPVVATPLPVAAVVAAVPAATYTPGSEEAAGFALLNSERKNCGFGLLQQSSKLDQSDRNHVNFLQANGIDFGHLEQSGLPFFTGVTETARAAFVSYQNRVTAVNFSSMWPTPAAGTTLRASEAIRTLFASPYHAIGMIDSHADIGIAEKHWAQPGNPGFEIGVTNITLGQRAGVNDLDPSEVYTYPCAGSVGVDKGLGNETPSPIPVNLSQSFYLYGTPIIVKVRNGKTLKVTSVTLAPQAGGAPVATTAVDRTNDPQGSAYIAAPASAAYALPMAKLLPLTAYTSTVTGTSDGLAFAKTFIFTTGK